MADDMETAMERMAELRAPAEPVEQQEIVEPEVSEAEEVEEVEADVNADEEEVDEVPTFDPPAAWSADGKEVFGSLDYDLQEEIVNRDKAAERGLRQKLDEVAEQRKVLEAEGQAIADAKARVATELQQAVAATDNLSPPDPTMLDPYHDNYDSDEYNRQRAVYEQGIAVRQTRVNQLNTYHAEQQNVAQQKRKVDMEDAARVLVDRNPTWTDPAVGAKAVNDIRAYMVTQGVQAEVANGVYNADILTMANKSMLYDRLKNADKKEKAKPRVARSSKQRTRQTNPDAGDAQKVHTESKSVESAVELLRAKRQANK